MLFMTKDQLKQFKYDWQNYPKDKLIEMYPQYTYSSLKARAGHFKWKKPKRFINKCKLQKLMDDTLYNWYWYGFILGDGSLDNEGELRMTLAIKDIDHLQKFADYIDINIHKREAFKYKQYTCSESCVINIKDAEYGIKFRELFKIDGPKTYNACSFECIKTKEQFLSLLIGLIDADGYVDHVMIRIQCHASWLDNFNFIRDWLIKLGIDSVKTKIDKREYVHLTIHKIRNINALYEYAKSNNLPYLERKWNKIPIHIAKKPQWYLDQRCTFRL